MYLFKRFTSVTSRMTLVSSETVLNIYLMFASIKQRNNNNAVIFQAKEHLRTIKHILEK